MSLRHPWRKIAHADPYMLTATLGLAGIGMVMVFSASSPMAYERYSDSAYFLKRQMSAAMVGLFVMSIFFFLRLHALRRLAIPGFLLSGILLMTTAFTSAGVVSKHATRWLNLGGISFQPTEFVKLALVIFVAWYLARKREKLRDFRSGLLPLLLSVSGILWLILRQPDFGNVVLLSLVIGGMLFVGGGKLRDLGGLTALACTAAVLLIQLAPYRKNRWLAFLDPWADSKGNGFQIIQSFIAFDRGGFSGQGLGDGTQKLLYLPEAHTDFVFSVVGEELGLIGSMLIIAGFAVILLRGFQLSLRLQDPFASHVAFGLTGLIGWQAFINLAVVMGLLPTKGITLPFVSFGGSSLVSSMAMIGILLSLSATVAMTGKMARRKAT